MHIPVSYTHLDVYKRQAEIVLWMIDATDATSQMNQRSGQILPRLERKHLILVFNKSDLSGTAHSDEVLSAASSILSLIHIEMCIRDSIDTLHALQDLG